MHIYSRNNCCAYLKAQRADLAFLIGFFTQQSLGWCTMSILCNNNVFFLFFFNKHRQAWFVHIHLNSVQPHPLFTIHVKSEQPTSAKTRCGSMDDTPILVFSTAIPSLFSCSTNTGFGCFIINLKKSFHANYMCPLLLTSTNRIGLVKMTAKSASLTEVSSVAQHCIGWESSRWQ